MSNRAYISRPVPLYIIFATQPGVIETLEGPVSYQPRDAIATGTAGERWPIPRARFEQRYLPADDRGGMGADGWFVKKTVRVLARQAEADVQVPLDGGRGSLLARSGDWILTGDEGEDCWVVADGIFQQVYAPQEQA